jgi:hypothetical protein
MQRNSRTSQRNSRKGCWLALATLLAVLDTDVANTVPKWRVPKSSGAGSVASSAAAEDVSSAAAASPRIGVLVQQPAFKGLFRDAECLIWALARDPVRLKGRVPGALSVFYTANYALLDMAVGKGVQCLEDRNYGRFCATANALNPGDSSSSFQSHMVPAGMDVRDWLKTVDVVVVFESMLHSFFAAAHALGVHRKVLVLNIDWTEPNSLLALHAEIPGLQLWAKGNTTHASVSTLLHDHLSRKGIAAATSIVAASVVLVPWSIPDVIIREDSRLAFFSGKEP